MTDIIKKKNTPKDVFYAYLIEGASRTREKGYPIIPGWMVAEKPPKELIQWNKKYLLGDDENEYGICFYCNDKSILPVVNNPKKYVDSLSKYQCVLGMDLSPYDNMPLVLQESQIYSNLAITYYFGRCGKKIIPNVRLGNMNTISSLEAYPKKHLIALGLDGFVKNKGNKKIYSDQVGIVINTLIPSGIVVYGPRDELILKSAIENNVPIYQYDSYMMKRDQKRKVDKIER